MPATTGTAASTTATVAASASFLACVIWTSFVDVML
jgi:hypothetical protein